MKAPTVYFIQTQPPNGPVKIGYTRRNVTARVAEGQTFSADSIFVLAEAYGTKEDESKLHKIFTGLHIRGEWFKYGEPLQDLVLHLLDGYSLQHWIECNL